MPLIEEKQKAIEIKLIPDPEMVINYPRHYANYAEVQTTPYDFTIRFCDAIPVFEKLKNGTGILEKKIPVVAEIVIPLNLVPSLIEAMQQQYDQYIKLSKESIEHGKKK